MVALIGREKNKMSKVHFPAPPDELSAPFQFERETREFQTASIDSISSLTTQCRAINWKHLLPRNLHWSSASIWHFVPLFFFPSTMCHNLCRSCKPCTVQLAYKYIANKFKSSNTKFTERAVSYYVAFHIFVSATNRWTRRESSCSPRIIFHTVSGQRNGKFRWIYFRWGSMPH